MTIAPDKRNHFKAGALICCFAAVICIAIGATLSKALIIGTSSAFVAGVLKEVWDHFHPKANSVETWDAAATFLGGLTVALLVYVMRWGAALMSTFLLTCGAAP